MLIPLSDKIMETKLLSFNYCIYQDIIEYFIIIYLVIKHTKIHEHFFFDETQYPIILIVTRKLSFSIIPLLLTNIFLPFFINFEQFEW